MKLFNTKKLQEEWQKKVEESYIQGKKDAENGFNNLLNAVTKDKETWNALSEKELLIEIMLALKFNNNNVEGLNNKISYIQNYKDIFENINNNINDLKKSESSLNQSIENEKKQILEFENLIKSAILKVNELDTTLKEIINIKDNINNLIKDIDSTIPQLQKSSEEINNISTNINKTIETYSDSPAEKLQEIKEKIVELHNELIENDCDGDSIKYKINDIYDKTNSALSEYDSLGLYSKIENLKDEVSNLNNKLDLSNFNSVYYKLQDIESKLDSINYSNFN